MAAPIDSERSVRPSRSQGRDPEPSSAGVGRGLMVAAADAADRRRRSADHSPGAALQRPRTTGWSRALEAQRRDHRRALAEVVEAGPVPAVDGVVRWRRKDLARWLLETFAISLDETTVGRELKALGFAKISARPRHYAQNELAVEAFKKNFPAELAKIRARLPKGWQRGALAPLRKHSQGEGRCPVRHRRHGGAPHRDQCRRRSRRPCGADRRSGRLALDAQAGDPRQHHRRRCRHDRPQNGQFMATTGTGSSEDIVVLPSLPRPTMEALGSANGPFASCSGKRPAGRSADGGSIEFSAAMPHGGGPCKSSPRAPTSAPFARRGRGPEQPQSFGAPAVSASCDGPVPSVGSGEAFARSISSMPAAMPSIC